MTLLHQLKCKIVHQLIICVQTRKCLVTSTTGRSTLKLDMLIAFCGTLFFQMPVAVENGVQYATGPTTAWGAYELQRNGMPHVRR